MKRKSTILLMVAMLILLSMVFVSAEENKYVHIWLNGEDLNVPLEYGQAFIDENSRTMVPLRIISETLGHEVEWDKDTQTAIIDTNISITIGDNIIKTLNGEEEMDTVAILKDERTYVPIKFIANALGYNVSYSGTGEYGRQHIIDIYEADGISLLDTVDLEEVKGIEDRFSIFERFIGLWVLAGEHDNGIPIVEITTDTMLTGWYASELASKSQITSKEYNEDGSIVLGLKTVRYMELGDNSRDIYREESMKITLEDDLLIIETDDGYKSEWTFGAKTMEEYEHNFYR